MSIHKSLKLKNTLARQRSVLTRWERIEKLKEQERWEEGDSVMGLPKVRTKFKIRSRKAIRCRAVRQLAQRAGDARRHLLASIHPVAPGKHGCLPPISGLLLEEDGCRH